LLVELNAEKLDESSKEYAGFIMNKAKRMQSLIKGLLDYAAATKNQEERTSLEEKTFVDRNIALEQATRTLIPRSNHVARGSPSRRCRLSPRLKVFRSFRT
jgi:light-regulated signal transduction histidine kinase (bacteriophytochrome)